MGYRLIGGSKLTDISPLTPIMALYDKDDQSDLYRDITGTVTTDIANTKAVQFTIDNIDTSFDIIEYIFLIYEDIDLPTIVSFSETIPASGSVTQVFTNTDNDLTTLSLVELNFINSDFEVAKDIAIKDNRLIAANLQLREFEVTDEEFDARAYRYNSGGTATIYQSDGTSTTVLDYDDIDFEHDAINRFNLPDNDTNFEPNKYQSDGVTLGGEGPQIKYSFITEDIVGDNRGVAGQTPWSGTIVKTDTTLQHNTNGVSVPIVDQYYNYTSPFLSAYLKGYQRDEIYRFAIVFTSKKGNHSFAKWIGDIRMPHVCEQKLAGDYDDDNGTISGILLKVLGIEFDVTIPTALANNIQGYQIVRVKRDNNDRTRLGGGVHLPLKENGSDIENDGFIDTNDTDQIDSDTGQLGWYPNYYTRFVSPLHLFREDNDYGFKQGDYLQFNYGYGRPVSLSGWTTYMRDVLVTSSPVVNYTKVYNPYCYSAVPNSNNIYSSFPTSVIKDQRYIPNEGSLEISDVDENTGYDLYHNRRYSGTNLEGGQCTFMDMETSMLSLYQNIPGNYTGQMPYFTYCRTISKQYGGDTYESRSSNEYIPTHSFVATNESDTVKVFGGDTYVHYFAYEYITETDSGDPENENEVWGVMFPCESYINVNLRHDYHFNKDRTVNQVLDADSTYEHFNYKAIYTQESTSQTIFQAKNYLANTNNDFPYSIWASENKINGELVDSWAAFLPANRMDVEGIYGPINSIHNFKDKLFFYQDKAFGVAPVNERAMITDENGAELQLGTGDVLGEFAYISTHTGAFHRTAVIPTENNIYHFDIRQKKLWRYTLDKDTDNPTGFLTNATINGPINVHGAYEHRYNRILLTFLLPEDEKNTTGHTVSYNELIDGFESFYDYEPKLYISTGRKLLSVSPNDNSTVYQHDEGSAYGVYYGNDPVASTIEFIINGGNEVNKRWDNLEWLSEVWNGTTNISETYGKLRITNEYQDTGSITLNEPDTVKRRFRTWRHGITRDVLVPGEEPRIRNPWIRLKLEYANTDGYRFVGHDMTTHFQPHTINDYS
jgi:hypothetical protein